MKDVESLQIVKNSYQMHKRLTFRSRCSVGTDQKIYQFMGHLEDRCKDYLLFIYLFLIGKLHMHPLSLETMS